MDHGDGIEDVPSLASFQVSDFMRRKVFSEVDEKDACNPVQSNSYTDTNNNETTEMR